MKSRQVKNREVWIAVGLLLLAGMFAGSSGCKRQPPSPIATPSPAPKPATPSTSPVATTRNTPTPSPAVKPSPTTSTPAQPQGIIKWKAQALFVPGAAFGPWKVTGNSLFATQWVEHIQKLTGGRLQIDLLPPDTLFPSANALEAVGTGMVDVIPNMYGGYYGAKLPEAYVEAGIPFNAESIKDVWTLVYSYPWYDLMREAYAQKNIYYLANFPGQPRRINMNFASPSSDSWKGKKIRATGYDAEIALMLGATPTNTPAPETYLALKLKAVDGIFGSIAALEFLKLKEVSSDILLTPLVHVMNNSIANMDSIKRLPDDIREIVTRETRYIMLASANEQASQEE